ncbi:MAG: hypothetical protein DMD41_05160 [Gemmatimonadetes bacterium]|nr:MAG: hypothetical protein DMD41_05160 [Gemmatimonadota bacterium]
MGLRRPVFYPLSLLVGALLVTAAALAHPALVGDGATQLATIAASGRWTTIHWAFLFAFPLSITGLVGVVGVNVGTRGESAARAGLVVSVFAYACWMIIVAFMLGAGGALAGASRGPLGANALFLYDVLRPFALATQRVGGFSLGLATYLFGWGVWNGKVLPPWTALLAIAGGAAGAALALAAPASSPLDQVAYAPPIVWQLVTALALLRAPQPS